MAEATVVLASLPDRVAALTDDLLAVDRVEYTQQFARDIRREVRVLLDHTHAIIACVVSHLGQAEMFHQRRYVHSETAAQALF